ncbi:MAG: hypothetical protein PHS86_08845 [Syntrophaceae bacterium]|nr:hypothetical protein [Syntrophaceae bacterium]
MITEEICREILEQVSERKCNGDSQKIKLSKKAYDDLKGIAIDELINQECLKGTDCSNKDIRYCWIGLEITPLGLDYLQKLQKQKKLLYRLTRRLVNFWSAFKGNPPDSMR